MTTTPPVEPDPTETDHDDEEGVEDFDAFFAQYVADRVPARCKIRGILITAPVDVPVVVELRAGNAATEEELEYILGLVFGEGVMSKLIDAGIGERELEILLVWAQVNASGIRATLPEVAQRLEDAEAQAKADAEGKAPTNRAARRRASKPKSAGTGR